MKKETYLSELKSLEREMERTSNTSYAMFAKVLTLVVMNMRYEKVAFGTNLKEHPFLLTRQIVRDAKDQFRTLIDASFIESENRKGGGSKSLEKEKKHKELFDEIWNRYGRKDYDEYVKRYMHRIDVNTMEDLIKGKKCVDMGCGNGNFCIALLKRGAALAAGVDYGKKSIEYSRRVAREYGFSKRAIFKYATVYKTGFVDDMFDFAIQNGVFHHLDNENKAISETKRILKKGGWFWYYTDGEGGISYDLWDKSVYLLRKVPVLFIEDILKSMNVRRNKIVHLMDGLSATYAHTSWDKITKKLSSFGFSNFKRLTGGFDTDCDLDRIEADPYGREKFGEGDLRILCQLTEK